MRSRTELVTTTIDNSDLSDTDLEDSEDDWKPSADNVIIVFPSFYFFLINQNFSISIRRMGKDFDQFVDQLQNAEEVLAKNDQLQKKRKNTLQMIPVQMMMSH